MEMPCSPPTTGKRFRPQVVRVGDLSLTLTNCITQENRPYTLFRQHRRANPGNWGMGKPAQRHESKRASTWKVEATNSGLINTVRHRGCRFHLTALFPTISLSLDVLPTLYPLSGLWLPAPAILLSYQPLLQTHGPVLAAAAPLLRITS